MISERDRANILVQALPYIQKYAGKTIVIKYGGNAMINEQMKAAVIADICWLTVVGINVVLVHGGGPEINEMLTKIGKETKFINGLRYTDAETMEIVQMVLAGKVNKDLVSLFDKQGAKAIGLCGLDSGMIKAEKLKGDVDYGLVGEITEIDTKPIIDLIRNGYIPVVSTIAQSPDGTALNVNADTAAAKIATALGAEKIILLTDVKGVLKDKKVINGCLHTVGPIASKRYKVYSENHREYSVLAMKNFGEIIQIEVGALLVGKIKNHPVTTFNRGDEKGYFCFGGSTIVLLFKGNTIKVDEDIISYSQKGIETKVKMGEKIGSLLI